MKNVLRYIKRLSKIAEKQQEIVSSVLESFSLQQLQRLSIGYVPWSSSAMSPSSVVSVVNDIILNKRRLVLELGTGISTLFVAKVLEDLGEGCLITIDHDKTWQKMCINLMNTNSIKPPNFLPITAELSYLYKVDNQEVEYYSMSEIEDTLNGSQIDMLIIDGPPAYSVGKELSRVPAAELFLPYMSDQSSVFVDDSTRAGEIKLIDKFEKLGGYSFQHKPNSSLAIGFRGGNNYNIS